MGATMAPDYANLYLGFLEDRYVFNNNPFFDNIILFKRCIDDCFVIYKGSESDFEAFVLYINCLRPSIKFTYQVGITDVNFLDTSISIVDNQIVSSLYRKDTAKNSLLHAKSAHSMPLKRGLPYSQFCSKKYDFEAKAQNLYMDFKSQGYPNKWLDTVLEKASSLQKQEERNLTMKKRNNFFHVFSNPPTVH